MQQIGYSGMEGKSKDQHLAPKLQTERDIKRQTGVQGDDIFGGTYVESKRPARMSKTQPTVELSASFGQSKVMPQKQELDFIKLPGI